MPEAPCVLIVDDEILLAEIGAEWLQRKGFRVLTAENGSAAWKILQKTKVDVVVTDIRMPVMDGLALLEKIYASGPGAPHVIFVTAYSDFDPRNAYALGLESILTKPLRRQQLEKAVERALTGPKRAWSVPPHSSTGPPIRNSFVSLADAILRGLIALGRGGVCLAATFRLPGIRVPLDLRLVKEAQRIAGQGIVRWSDRERQQVGVEITYLEDDCRDWVVKLLSDIGITSFIPRETTSGT